MMFKPLSERRDLLERVLPMLERKLGGLCPCDCNCACLAHTLTLRSGAQRRTGSDYARFKLRVCGHCSAGRCDEQTPEMKADAFAFHGLTPQGNKLDEVIR